MPELNACPVCGKQPVLQTVEGYPMQYKLFCGTHVSVGEWFSNTEGAEIDWNRRTTDKTQPDFYLPTRADRFRAMSDEEMAVWMLKNIDCNKEYVMCSASEYKHFGKCNGKCIEGRLNWLRQPAEE